MTHNLVFISLLTSVCVTSLSSVAHAGIVGESQVKFQGTIAKQCEVKVILKGRITSNKPLPTQLSSLNYQGIPIKVLVQCNSTGLVLVSSPSQVSSNFIIHKIIPKASVTDPINGNTVYSDGTGLLAVPGDGKQRILDVNMTVAHPNNSILPQGLQAYSVTVTVTP